MRYSGTPFRRQASVAALLGLALSFAATQPAFAQEPARQRAVQARENLREQVQQQRGVSHYQREAPSGVERVYAHVPRNKAPQLQAVLHEESNVLEVLQLGRGSPAHTRVVFDGKVRDTRYNPDTSPRKWHLYDWGPLRPRGGRELHSALIQLTDTEAENLGEILAEAKASQERGNDRYMDLNEVRLGGDRRLNCTTTWSEVSVGENGEPLWQLLGLDRRSLGSPRGFQRALRDNANERVFGYMIYGTRPENFVEDAAQAPGDLGR